MAEIVGSVLAALQPLVDKGVVTEVRMAGAVGSHATLKPILSVAIKGEHPETHAAEVSRLLEVAGLDVDWTIEPDYQI